MNKLCDRWAAGRKLPASWSPAGLQAEKGFPYDEHFIDPIKKASCFVRLRFGRQSGCKKPNGGWWLVCASGS